ncbi:hypothetical protein K7W42_08180 [Deinococcus sp. HMF7604]|nr:hypothetical protein [Deinococcus betulae]MBZ9750839.1 hypothetical protein [Deinococcus betulae]
MIEPNWTPALPAQHEAAQQARPTRLRLSHLRWPHWPVTVPLRRLA